MVWAVAVGSQEGETHRMMRNVSVSFPTPACSRSLAKSDFLSIGFAAHRPPRGGDGCRLTLFLCGGFGRDLDCLFYAEAFEDALRGFAFGFAGAKNHALERFVGQEVDDVKIILRLLQGVT